MGGRSMTVGLRHIDRFKDRHGRVRYYYRPPGGKRVALPDPDHPGFLAAYHRAAAAAPKPVKAPSRGADGTFDRLVFDYYRSAEFRALKASSQAVTRGILDAFCREHGHRLVEQMKRQNASKIIGDKADTPAAANNLRKKLRVLMKFAIANEWREDDPLATIPRYKEGTHHTWKEEEIAAFEARWPIGSRQRLVFALALYTGQRRADLAKMTWRAYDEAAGVIEVAQEKLAMEQRDERLYIPVHRDLARVLAATKREHVMILATSFGKAFAVAGLGNYMADAIAAAGLPDRCVLHGLRKAAARRLAEAGCTAHQIAAITGHKTLSEIERYTKSAEQKGLARAAVTRLEEHSADNDSQPSSRFGKTEAKS